MNTMAGKVLQDRDKREKDEEKRIRDFEKTKQMRENKAEELRMKKTQL